MFVVLVVVALAGCATRKAPPAPVVEGRAARAAAAKPAPARAEPPAVRASPPAPAPSIARASGDYYTVRRGDTLYSIALEHGADYREVAQWNSLDDPTRILVGQQLRVTPPEAERTAQVNPVRIAGRVEARPLEARPLDAKPLETRGSPAPEAKPVDAKPMDAKPADPPRPTGPEAAAGQFMWPARGKVLAEFAEPRRKGIDIDGKPGDPVVAAAAGRVTYIGTGIPGMGKLVVIKHGNGYITVYAHNRDILVKEQQEVARGQKIAELGSTDADRPKLHFQIRKGAAAVDPLLYLPRS